MANQENLLNEAAASLENQNAAPRTSNDPLVKYASLLTSPEDEREGTFIMPSEEGDVIRLYDNNGWSDPSRPEGFMRIVSRYGEAGGEFGDKVRLKTNSILFRGDVRGIKLFLDRWAKAGEVQAMVAHLEFTMDEIEEDARLQRLLDADKMSVKMIPARDGNPEEILLYNNRPAYMYQQLVHKPFDAVSCMNLTKRLGQDDLSAERYAKAKADYDEKAAKAKEAVEKVRAARMAEAKRLGLDKNDDDVEVPETEEAEG